MFGQIVGGISAALKALFRLVRTLPKRFGWKKILLGAAAIALLFMVLSFLSGGSPEAPASTNDTRSIEIRSVLDLSSETSGLSVGGTVSSVSEATIRAERSGEITSLNYELGDSVRAGALIAEIKNAAERAAVLQAQAGLESARASAMISGSSIEEARSGVVTALLSAYSATDNATRGTSDSLFSNPQTNPNFTYPPVALAKGSEDTNAERLRKDIIPVVARQSEAATTVSVSSNLTAELDRTEEELRSVRAFLDATIQALNTAKTEDPIYMESLAQYKSTTVAARTAVTSALSGLASAKQTLLSAEQSGGSGSSLSSAAIKQAEASLAAARANLEQTIIRAPISGTINSLSLKLGDYIQVGTPAATIANNSALEVIAYVTESDAREFSVGSKATIRGGIGGTVTRVAPAIDPINKKIEVRIGVENREDTLVNGESVSVTIARSEAANTPTSSRLTIPLSALKIGADGMTVFTLADDSTLVPHPVTIGLLLGDRVEIIEGLAPEMRIVVDARGLRAGERVILK